MSRFHRQGQHSVTGSRRKGINPEIINVGFTVDSALYGLIETDAGCVDFGIGIIVGSIGGIGGGSEDIGQGRPVAHGGLVGDHDVVGFLKFFATAKILGYLLTGDGSLRQLLHPVGLFETGGSPSINPLVEIDHEGIVVDHRIDRHVHGGRGAAGFASVDDDEFHHLLTGRTRSQVEGEGLTRIRRSGKGREIR